MININQDPWWRSRVLPLFKFDPELPAKRPIAMGTAFRIDPYGTALTAFHVIEEFLSYDNSKLEIFSSERLVALDMPEGIYAMGRVGIPREWWRALCSLQVLPVGLQTSPLFHEPDRIQNVSEMAVLGFAPLIENSAPYLPVRLRGRLPKNGDTVTAYGFAGLDSEKFQDDAISQYLYDVSGTVTELISADPQSRRPWPKLVVDAHWPSGMSGGPVVNSSGEVVGLVSTSFEGEGTSTALLLSGWNFPERSLPTLDPNNPGWFRGFAAIDAAGTLRFFGHDDQEVLEYAKANGLDARSVSMVPETGEWVSLTASKAD